MVDNKEDNIYTGRSFLSVHGSSVTGNKIPTNYIETLIHIIKAYIGTGIFALGSGFKNSGILLGPILLIDIALINLHCQHLFMKACAKIAEKEKEQVFPSFGETVQYVFEDSSCQWLNKHSKTLGIFTNIFVVLAECGYCVTFFTFVSKHFTEIAVDDGWNVDYRVMLLIILIPMWISTFLKNLKLLTPVSLIADVLLWIGIIIILYYSSTDLVPLDERNLVANYKKLPLFFGIVTYSLEGITFIINIRKEMKDPNDFLKPFGVLNVGLLIVVFFYLIVGFFTYWKYGEDIKASAFLNIPANEKCILHKRLKNGIIGISRLAKVTRSMIAIAILFTYSLHMYITFEISYPLFYTKFGPFRHPFLTICIYKSALVIVTYLLANISKKLTVFISFVGAFNGSILSLILPATLELASESNHPKKYVVMKNTLIIIFAIFGIITGVTSSVYEIIEEYSNVTYNKY